MLYGFHEPPPLNVNTTWTEKHSTFVPANSHKARSFPLYHSIFSVSFLSFLAPTFALSSLKFPSCIFEVMYWSIQGCFDW